MTDDGENEGGGVWGMMVPGTLRNLEACPEFGVGAGEGDIGKIREVIKTDSKCKEALNVKTGSWKLTTEGWRRQKRRREVGSDAVTGAPETYPGIGSLGWLELRERKDCKGRENFQLSCVSQIYK